MKRLHAEKEIGARLRIIRKSKKLRQCDIAALLNTSPQIIGAMERGDRRIHADTILALSEKLEIPAGFFLQPTSSAKETNSTITEITSKLHQVKDQIHLARLSRVIDSILELQQGTYPDEIS